MTVNVENILRVAQAIENHSIRDLGFNISIWKGNTIFTLRGDTSGHNCRTVACIGGWAQEVLLPPSALGTSSRKVGEALGLNGHETERLFFDYPSDLAAMEPFQAVALLRHLAATGEIDWDVARGAEPTARDCGETEEAPAVR